MSRALESIDSANYPLLIAPKEPETDPKDEVKDDPAKIAKKQSDKADEVLEADPEIIGGHNWLSPM